MATLYGAQGTSRTTSDLYTIDETDGSYTSVGPIGFALTGMAWDPASSTMYGSTSNNSAASPRSLITINLGTGVGTLVGALGLGASHAAADLCFTSDGQLWGIDSSNGHLVQVDKTTGAASPIGSTSMFGGLVRTTSDTFISAQFSGGALRLFLFQQDGDTNAEIINVGAPSTIYSLAAATTGPDDLIYCANTFGVNNLLNAVDLVAEAIVLDVASLPYMDALAWDVDVPLTPPAVPGPPIVVTGSAIPTANSALLQGTVNPNNGGDTTYRFQFGTTTGYGTQTSAQTVPDGGSPVSVEREIGEGGFDDPFPSTLYHYRLIATNAEGTANGSDQTFTTPAYPGSPPANDDIT